MSGGVYVGMFRNRVMQLVDQCVLSAVEADDEIAEGVIRPAAIAIIAVRKDGSESGSDYVALFEHNDDVLNGCETTRKITDEGRRESMEGLALAYSLGITEQAVALAVSAVFHAAMKNTMSDMIQDGKVLDKQQYRDVVRGTLQMVKEGVDETLDVSYEAFSRHADSFLEHVKRLKDAGKGDDAGNVGRGRL